MNAFVLKWRISLDGVRRFHYGVGRQEVPLPVPHSPICVSYVLMRPVVGVMDETTELIHLNKDSLWLSR